MKRIKMLVLGSAAVMAVTAVAGVASASASNTTVCDVSTNPCPTGNVFPTGATNGTLSAVLAAHGGATTAVLHSNTLGTVTCMTSSAGGNLTVNPGTTATGGLVTGSLSSLAFGSCKDALGNTCTATPNSLPYNASVSNTALATGSNGTFQVSNPNVSVTCLGVTCTYTATAQGASAYNPSNANAPDQTTANKVHAQTFYNGVGLTSSNCLNDAATFTANYVVQGKLLPAGTVVDLWVQ